MNLNKKTTQRIKEKIKSHSSIIKKAIVGLCITISIGGAITGLTGCKNTSNNNYINPGVNVTNSYSTTSSKKGKYSQYSDILQAVLTEEKYIDLAKDGMNNAGINRRCAIPYEFLEKQGLDADKMFNDELHAESTVYKKENEPNIIYMYTKAECEAKFNYYTCFELKWSFTDAQMRDFQLLCDCEYIQAPLFIQKVAEVMTPEILNVVKISVNTDKMLQQYYQTSSTCEEFFGTNKVLAELNSFDKVNQTYKVTVRANEKSKTFTVNSNGLTNSKDDMFDVPSVNGFYKNNFNNAENVPYEPLGSSGDITLINLD